MARLAKELNTNQSIQAASPTGTTQTITTSGSSAAISTAFGNNTRLVRIVATEDVHLEFATSPTATTSDPFLPANQVEYFRVTAGDKVAAIQNSAAGTVYVTEME